MNYEVNERTLLILPVGKERCKVYEDTRSYNINKSTFKVIEHSCEYFGVSYRSRLEGSKRFIKTRYKSPIVIEETSRLVFFPLSSPQNKSNYWISYNNVLEYYPALHRKNHTMVRFKNGLRLEVPVSFYSFNNQYLKASRLSAVLAERLFRNY